MRFTGPGFETMRDVTFIRCAEENSRAAADWVRTRACASGCPAPRAGRFAKRVGTLFRAAARDFERVGDGLRQEVMVAMRYERGALIAELLSDGRQPERALVRSERSAPRTVADRQMARDGMSCLRLTDLDAPRRRPHAR